jgi:hypothetical protein
MFAPFGEKPAPWEDPNPLWEASQAAQRLTAAPTPRHKTGKPGHRLAKAAEWLGTLRKGNRNTALYGLAKDMRPYVAAGELTITEVKDALLRASDANGLNHDDGENNSLKAIASGLGISKDQLR